jgi:hypothetical protein
MGARRMRLDDWDTRLEAVIAAADKPFAWGDHDCCTFAASCVEAVTGRQLWVKSAPSYRTAAGAKKALKKVGFDDLPSALDGVLGERKPVAMAQRGDVVLIDGADAPGCAVVDLSGEWAVGPSPDGVVRVRLAEAVAAWSV